MCNLNEGEIMIIYQDEAHKSLPHVINVSGGRSSGMILIRLLEEGLLNAERGDLAIFNNTSAEHHETYPFLQRLTAFTESKGIPFYWTEFGTYEHMDANNHAVRRQTYRMVQPIPFDPISAPDGFKSKGEVFEEFVSHSGYLPSRDRRGCTKFMKVFVKVQFLSDWFDRNDCTDRLGHHGNHFMQTEDSVWESHQKHKGKKTRDELLKTKSFVMQSPHVRPAQRFDAYSKTGKTHNLQNMDSMFLGCIGIRFDEPRRKLRLTNIGGNEVIYTPLFDAKIDKRSVNEFWKARSEMDINLPYDTEKSNCVYCFMKGPKKLAIIAKDDEGGRTLHATSSGGPILKKNIPEKRKPTYLMRNMMQRMDSSAMPL